ncbi:MAG: DUF4139 domain-containing protein [Candidatus Eiseniibacteriota bacterium]|nr:MAG: DUF4139 domain-containing protein [Candidatus Eisenbacteria bacterium]
MRGIKSAATLPLLCCLFFPVPLHAGQVAVTVYNENIALVKELREMSFSKGESEVEFTGVPSRIDPTSVHFVSKTAPDAVAILEQNYEYDLVSATKLLEKYVDSRITVFSEDEKMFEGLLLSYDAQNLVLAPEGKGGPVTVVSREEVRHVVFPTLPRGLITRPTLVWKLLCEKAGEHQAEVSYLTDGMNWHAEYVAVSGAGDDVLGIAGWVSVDNRSGATYEDAKLKLVAGAVHRVQEKRRPPLLVEAEMPLAAAAAMEERAFFEYHLYSLERPTTLKNNEVKQVSLFPEAQVKTKKVFTYDGARYPKDVRITLEFKNTEAEGLGVPLPKGVVRVYKEDIDKSLEFIGEDAIEHTPKGEKVRIYVGNAFDIVGERSRESFRQITKTLREETFQIKLRTHKEEPIEVTVVERIWGQWQIVESSHEYVKKDANTVEFTVTVPVEQEVVVRYTTRVGY